MDDSELAARAAAGHADAFESLVDRYGGRVRALALRIAGGRRSSADDLTQEVFLHLLRVLPRYDRSRPFAPWLFEVAANLCRNKVRGERRRPAVSLDAVVEARGDEPLGASEDPGATAERSDELRRLRAARDALPSSYRTILAMHYEAGLSYEEIARALGALPLGTVKNRLHRARAALAARLGLGRPEGR